MMKLLGGITLVSWWVFMLVWALKYRGNKRNVHIQPARERWRYTLPFILGLIAMSGVLALLWPPLRLLNAPLWPAGLASFGASAALSLLGLTLALWARFTLGRDWSAQVTLKRDHVLVTHGPYATIRHPIYTALLLMFAALVLLFATPGALIGWALLAASCWVKLRQEEALLLTRFPDAYAAYMARTRRLVPYLV